MLPLAWSVSKLAVVLTANMNFCVLLQPDAFV